MTQSVLGIDIGRTGAIALLSPAGDLVDVVDMPVPAGRPGTSPGGQCAHSAIARWRPSCAYVEFVGARPTDGPAGAFAFGRARPHPGQATPHSSIESTLHPLADRTQG